MLNAEMKTEKCSVIYPICCVNRILLFYCNKFIL